MDIIWSSSPLSMTELGIYLDWTKNLLGTAYNIPWLFPLPQGTDLARLREALTEALQAHPGILSRFAAGEDGNVVRRTPTGAPEELSVTISESRGEPDLNALIRPFSDPEDELYRFQIIQGKEQAWLFSDIHHILFDGHSEDVFLSELNRAYHGLSPVGETLSAADFARQEQKMRETDAFEAAKKWYGDMLDGEETVSEPFHDHEGETWKCAWLERELDLSFEEVSAFVKAAGIRTGSFFTGVYGYLLSRFSGAEEALYSTIYHGRTPETMNTIGMFVKTFPVLERFKRTDNIREHLRQLDEQIRKSRENDLFSYADIISAFDLSIPTMFAYQGGLKGEKEFLDGRIAMENIESDDAKANIAVEVHTIGNACRLRIFWRTDLFEQESMEIFARCYEQIAKEFINKETFGDILLLTADDEAELDRFNATGGGLSRPGYRVPVAGCGGALRGQQRGCFQGQGLYLSPGGRNFGAHCRVSALMRDREGRCRLHPHSPLRMDDDCPAGRAESRRGLPAPGPQLSARETELHDEGRRLQAPDRRRDADGDRVGIQGPGAENAGHPRAARL